MHSTNPVSFFGGVVFILFNFVASALATVFYMRATDCTAWNFDKTGNWLQYNRAGVVENRTHNAANEIQSFATHDKNGNMTVMLGQKGKYDAWNRVVEVRDSSDTLLASYIYNGLNQRIKKTVGNVVTESFFN